MSFDKKWDNFYSNDAENDYPDPLVISFVMRLFRKSLDKGKIKILDLGCGLGGNTWFF